MAAVLGGLGAALIWSVGSAFASRAARALGPLLTLSWVMLIGLLALALVLPWSGSAPISVTAVVWLVLGGAGNVGGLLLMYRALRIGQLGVVMPIVCTEGGIAAVIAIIAGQPVCALAGAGLAATMLGVILTAIARRPGEALPPTAEVFGGLPAAVPTPHGHGDRRAAVWAGAAALSMSISLFATGRAGGLLPTAWAIMPPRVIGVLVVTIPLACRRRLRWVPGTGQVLFVAGLCEVGGFFAYASGARHSIAIAAVLSTLTGAIGAGFGRLLFGERLQPTQVAGVVIIFVGVASLVALTA
ncbi:MAG: EamA family transporter [Solirubrobacteraceae bacterium]